MPVEMLTHLIYNHSAATVKRCWPAVALRSVIECYCWYTAKGVNKLLAALEGAPCAVILLSDNVINLTGSQQLEIQGGFICRGIWKNTYLEILKTTTNFLVIQFEPDAAVFFEDLDTGIRPLSKPWLVLRKQLIDERRMNRRVALLNKFFTTQIKTEATGNYLLKRAVSLVKLRKGDITVEELGMLMNVNYKWLERNFRSYLSVTPKSYINNIKILYAYTVMEREHKLTGVAMEAGYYDQSHFIKAYRKFTGTLPSALK